MTSKEYEELSELTGERLPQYLHRAIPFNKLLVLKGFHGENLVNEICSLVKRNNKLTIRRLDIYIKNILANLVHANYLHRHFVYYSARYNEYIVPKKYDPLSIGYRPFVKTIDELTKLGLIKTKRGYNLKPARRSRMIATSKLNKIINKYNVVVSDVLELPIDEIQLKDKNKKFIDFIDSPSITKSRNILKKYNALLHKTTISLKQVKQVKDYVNENNYKIDTLKQSYHRIFSNSSWQQGGRFYGPWWQYITNDKEKIELRKYLLINNKPTVELDYNSIHIHLLYDKENKVLDNSSDAYTLSGYEDKRAMVKTAILIAINCSSDKYYSQTVANALSSKKTFQKGINYKKIVEVFKQHHPSIAKYLFSGAGIKLQNIDSQIAEYIIMKMTNKKIPVLNIHDSFVVERKYQHELKKVMTATFKYFKLKSLPTINAKKL